MEMTIKLKSVICPGCHEDMFVQNGKIVEHGHYEKSKYTECKGSRTQIKKKINWPSVRKDIVRQIGSIYFLNSNRCGYAFNVHESGREIATGAYMNHLKDYEGYDYYILTKEWFTGNMIKTIHKNKSDAISS